MMKRNSCSSRQCTCGDQKYVVKIAVHSIFHEHGNVGDIENCDISGLVYMLQQQLYDYEPIGRSLSNKIVQRANKEVRDLSFESKAISLAKFDIDELLIGPLLGSGGFSSVFEISSIILKDKIERDYSTEESWLRQKLAMDCQGKASHKLAPFAIKHLQRKLVDKPKRFANGAIDLTLEAAYLSSLNHPNILSVHGISAEGTEGYLEGRHDSYFLIVDRLHGTLHDRILTWRKQHKWINNAWGRHTDKKGKKGNKLLMERLQVAADIASALEYIHSRNLVYRDLKPTNIGFGQNGEVKLFDFGLCRELPAGADRCLDTVYNMSGGVGTYRYMSPEVANRENYNQGADVFSFGMVLYEMLSLNEPTIQDGQKTVDPRHLRICKCWPESVKELMVRTWSPFISERPTMEEVCIMLRNKIADLEVCNSMAVSDKLILRRRQGNIMNGHQKRFQSFFRKDDVSVGTTTECSSMP